jgi:hypothetical protein
MTIAQALAREGAVEPVCNPLLAGRLCRMVKYGEIANLLSTAITQAVRDLLTNRHLYQSIEVSVSATNEHIQALAKASEAAIRTTLLSSGGGVAEGGAMKTFLESAKVRDSALAATWDVTPPPTTMFGLPAAKHPDIIYFDLPTIFTVCSNPKCKQRSPFNPSPLHEPVGSSCGEVVARDMCEGVQVFVCAYQCQSCKTEPLVFLIRRRGGKLTLAGRSRIENISAPAFLPKHVREFYSDAVIAFNSGKPLPGLFMLRVVIEQFWSDLERRRVLIVSDERGRLHADQLADAYNSILPPEFRDRFPSLGKIYKDISERLHNATADTELFEKSEREIVEHFDARRVMKLDAEDEKRAKAASDTSVDTLSDTAINPR